MTVTEPAGSSPSFPPPIGGPASYGWAPVPGGNGRPEQSLRDLARRIARRRWLLASVAIVVFGLVAVWTFTATPRYKSEARLRINPRAETPTLPDAVTDLPGAGLLGLQRDELETEVAVLRSDRIADATIDSLALNVRVLTPASNRAAMLSARVLDPSIDIDGKTSLTREADGRYRVDERKIDDATTLPPVFVPGTPIRVGGTEITLAPALRASGPEQIVVQFMPRYEVHKLWERRLLIARQEGGSRLVEVSFEDPDRALAAQVVRRIVAEFVTYTVGTERTEDTTTVGHLRAEVAITQRRLASAETTLRAFEERQRLIAPQEQATAQVQRITAISTRVDAISVERNALARMLAIIDERARGSGGPSAYRQLATFPSLISNRAIQDLLLTLVNLENQRSTVAVRRTTENAEYKQIVDRIAEVESQLYSVGSEYLESLDQQLATTVNAVTALADTMQAIPGATMRYGRLIRDRTLLESTYMALQKQLKQAELKDVLRQDRVRVIDAPRVANVDDPSFPKKAVMLALGLVLALALALTVGLAAELWREPV